MPRAAVRESHRLCGLSPCADRLRLIPSPGPCEVIMQLRSGGDDLGSRRKAHTGMKWFRSNVKHGSRLVLFTLAAQFAVSFGHFHGTAAQAVPAMKSCPVQSSCADDQPAQAAVGESVRQQLLSNHDSGQQPNDPCSICGVIALANTVIFATPPLLWLPQAIEFLYQTTGAEFIHLNSARVAFRPRAPPVS